MQFKHVLIAIIVVGLGFFAYRSAVSLPERSVANAQALKVRLVQTERHIKELNEALTMQTASPEWAFYQPYAEREGWQASMTSAVAAVAAASANYDSQVTPILMRNHQDDRGRLQQHLVTLRRELDQALGSAKQPGLRAKFLMAGYENKDRYLKEAEGIRGTITRAVAGLEAKAQHALSTAPHQQADIVAKFAGAERLAAESQVTYDTLVQQYRAPATDFSVYGEAHETLQRQRKEIQRYVQHNSALLAQLDRQYMKVLVDQKINHYVVIGRASWCNGDYCGSGDTDIYPARQVDPATFNYLEETSVATIAEMSRSSFSTRIPRGRWDALGISPTWRWSSSHNYAEYWIEKTYSEAFHRYQIVEDGKISDSGWVEVSEADYEAHHDNVGMAIASKPKGYYESQTNQLAEPAGMALVAAPTVVDGVATGANQYGEWQQNSSGQSFFHYYGMYSLFRDLSGGGYYYSDWDHYNRRDRRSAYYGHGQYRQYGTYGKKTAQSTLFKRSNYAKRNPSVFSKAGKVARSVRGSGPANRGRGPSGSGK